MDRTMETMDASLQQPGDEPFAVVKFPPGAEDEDTYFEVGLRSWLVGSLNDEMEGETLWPPETANNISNMIKHQQKPDTAWKKFKVVVMRFYDTYVRARLAVSKFVVDSNYETDQEAQIGRGRRVRNRQLLLESDSDEEIVVRKRAKKVIPPPPPVTSKNVGPPMIRKEVTPVTNKKVVVPVNNHKKVALPVNNHKKVALPVYKKIVPTVNKRVANKKVVKGRPETAADLKRQQLKETMERLKAAREAAAAKMRRSPAKATSPWKVTPHKNQSPDRSDASQSSVDSPNPMEMVEVNLSTPKSSKAHQPDTPLVVLSPSNSTSSMENSLNREKSFYFSPSNVKVELEATPTPGVEGTTDYGDSPIVVSCGERPGSSGTQHRRVLFEEKSQGHIKSRGRDPPPGEDRPKAGRLQGNVCSSGGSSNTPRLVAGTSSVQSSVSSRRKSSTICERKSSSNNLSRGATDSRSDIVSAEISAKLDILLMNVARIARAVMPGEKRLSIPKDMPKLPLENSEQLDKFESFLEKSDINLAATVDYMGSYVRTNVVDPERKSGAAILAKLLTNSLAKGINLDGGNNKISFRKLQLYRVYQGTLQSAFPNSDLSIADDAAQKWLKDAKWRKQTPEASAA